MPFAEDHSAASDRVLELAWCRHVYHARDSHWLQARAAWNSAEAIMAEAFAEQRRKH